VRAAVRGVLLSRVRVGDRARRGRVGGERERGVGARLRGRARAPLRRYARARCERVACVSRVSRADDVHGCVRRHGVSSVFAHRVARGGDGVSLGV